MTRGEDHLLCGIFHRPGLPGLGRILTVEGLHFKTSVCFPVDVRHPGAEMNLSAVVRDATADVLDHFREPIRADVRMGVDQNSRIGSEVDELMKHFPNVPAFRGAV